MIHAVLKRYITVKNKAYCVKCHHRGDGVKPSPLIIVYMYGNFLLAAPMRIIALSTVGQELQFVDYVKRLGFPAAVTTDARLTLFGAAAAICFVLELASSICGAIILGCVSNGELTGIYRGGVECVSIV